MEIRDLCWVEKDPNSDKKGYHKVGIVMIKDDGNLSIRINTLPRTGVKWDGWLAAFARDRQKQDQGNAPEEHSELEPF